MRGRERGSDSPATTPTQRVPATGCGAGAAAGVAAGPPSEGVAHATNPNAHRIPRSRLTQSTFGLGGSDLNLSDPPEPLMIISSPLIT